MPSIDEINALWVLGASVAGLVGWVWRAGLYGVWRAAVDYMATPVAMRRAFASVQEQLAAIRHEVLPNGGGSLRDSVDRTERQTSILSHGLNFLLSEAHTVSVVLSPDGLVTEVSPRGPEKLGVRAADLLGDGWLSHIAPEHSASVADDIRAAIRQQRGTAREIAFIARDGTRYLCAVELRPVRDPRGGVSGFLGFVRRVA